MADATKLPTASELKFFYWANKPTLTAGLSADSTDNNVSWSTPPTDLTAALITGGFLMGVTNKAGNTERIWVPANAVNADGLGATGVVRGIDPNGIDYTVGNDDFILALDGGSRITCVIAAQSGELIRATLQNLIATGATGMTWGIDAVGTITFYRSTGPGTKLGFLRWNLSSGKTEYANDGVTWNTFDAVTASNLIIVSNSDTTPSNLQNKTASGTGITRAILNPGGNERLEFSVNGTLAQLISDVTATSVEINQALDGISPNVTFTNLNTLTAGPNSNADLLHTHTAPAFGFTAGEAINGSANAKVVAQLGENYKKIILINANGFTLIDASVGTARAVGDVDARTRLAQSFVLTDADASTIKLENVGLILRKQAAPTDDFYAEIQTDSGGSPSGTVVTNGTSSVIGGASLTTNYGPVKFTWATPPALASGTTYWIVFRRSTANDAVNYYQVLDAGGATYASGEAKTYTASTLTWSAALANDVQMELLFELDYDGKVFMADSNDLKRIDVVGVTTDNKSAAQTLAVAVSAYKNGLTGLTRGAPVFLSTTQGGYTQTTPSVVANTQPRVQIGKAISTDTVLLDIKKEFLGQVPASGNIQLGAGAAGTFDHFVECGFQPRKIKIFFAYDDTGVAPANSRYLTEFIGTQQVVSYQIEDVGATGSLAAGLLLKVGAAGYPQALLSVQEICENGFILRFTSTGSVLFSSIIITCES